MTPHELKALRERRARLIAEEESTHREKERIRAQHATLVRDLAAIDEQLQRAESTGPQVTEHAILRFAQRAMGLDPADIQRRILTPEVRRQIQTIGSGKIPICGGVTAVVKNNVVVSVY
jgi:hypothetical protein